MLDIETYHGLIKVILGEFAKYFFLLLLSILSIRCWRHLPKTSGTHRRHFLLVGAASTLATVVIGYYSICHSLGRLYSHYGLKAFTAGNIEPAGSLFQSSLRFWPNADAIGQNGVCLLWLGQTNQGLAFIERARVLRGRNTPFEEYYKGLHFYFHEQFDQAVPLLEDCSRDPAYDWNVTKLFSVINLEKNQPAETRRLMAPFAQVPVEDYDHAYIAAALDRLDGKTNDAKALVDRFDTTNLPPFWKTRFDKLRSTIQNPAP